MFDELFDPEGLRLAYITITAHMRGYRCTRIRVHTSIWILDPSALKCVHVQELPTHHVRAKECRRLCRPDISWSVGRSVGRAVRFCEFALQNYDGTNSRALVSAAKTFVPSGRNYERSLNRVGGIVLSIL